MKLRISDDLSLPLDWMSLATVVYGARGSGKTTLGAVIAEEVTRAKQRFCAIDLKGDWYGIKSTADGRGDGIPLVIFGGDHADVPLEEGAGTFVGETVAGLDQSCVLDFEHFTKGKQVRFLADFLLSLYHKNREPLVLLADEAQRYLPQRPMDPDATRCLGAGEDVVKLGRKHGLGVVLFTQRGSGLNKEVSELCDLLVAFRTPGPLDQDRIKDWLDANTTKAQRDEVMGSLAGLPTGTAVFASGHPDLKLFGVHAVRRRETFDSSATPKVGQRRAEPKRLATPDLEELRTKMAAAIERQKAEDPKELRKSLAEKNRRIVDLEKQVAGAIVKTAPVKTELKRVEVPILKDGQVKRFEDALARTEKLAASVQAPIAHLQEIARGVAGTAHELRAAIDAAKAPVPQARIASAGTDPRAERVSAPRPPVPRREVTPADGLTPVKQRILNALALFEGIGIREVDKAQLALLSDASPTSGSYFNNLGSLRAAGYIDYPSAGVIALTDQGRAVADSSAAPSTTEDLHALLRAKLSPVKWRILEALVGVYPETLTKEQLADAIGVSATSGSYFNNLGSLRSLRLIDYPRPGEVTARSILFIDQEALRA